MAATTEDEIRWALQAGDRDVITQLITSDNVNKQVSGRYPLHHLSDYGHTDLVKYVLSIGATVDSVDKHGLTPLTCAVFEGHPDIVRILLSHGADKTVMSPDGYSLSDSTESEAIKNMLA